MQRQFLIGKLFEAAVVSNYVLDSDVFVGNSMVEMSLWEHGGCLETEL